MAKIQELFDLTGETAIVTGGATGLGLQASEALAEAGADLVICSRRKELCEVAAKELRKHGVKVHAARLDVTSKKDVETVVGETMKIFGSIDVLVNNAGTAWAAPPEETKMEDWRRIIETNVTGAFFCSQAVGPVMMRRRKGKIINVASVAGLMGTEPEVLDAISYSASKGALIALTKDLAVKWARHGINVNAIAPSFFHTYLTDWVIKHRSELIIPKIPLRRLGGDQDLKGAVLFLASRASEYVTGHTLVVDGGMSICL